MKQIFSNILLISIILLSGCTSAPSTPKKAKINISKKLQFSKTKLNLSQFVKTDIIYHTQDELNTIFNTHFTKLLKDNNLLSTDKNMDKLELNIDYKRRFLGDKTAIITDSLNYPDIAYTILITKKDGSSQIIKNKLKFKVNFVRDLKVFAGGFRDKKYELEFIDELSNAILNKIKN